MPSRKSAGPCSRASDRSAATGRVSWTEAMEGFRRMLPVTLYVVPMGLAFGAAALQQDLSGSARHPHECGRLRRVLAVRGPGPLVGDPGPGPAPAHHLRRQRPPCAARRLPGTLAQQAVALAPLRHRHPAQRSQLGARDPDPGRGRRQHRPEPAREPAPRRRPRLVVDMAARHGSRRRRSAATSATSPGSGSIFSSSPSSLPCSPASGAACGRTCCHGSRPPPWPLPAPGCCPAAGTCWPGHSPVA